MARQVWKLEVSCCFDLPPSALPPPHCFEGKGIPPSFGQFCVILVGAAYHSPCLLLTIVLEVGVKPKASQSEPFPGS